jgi:hypothetical protein
MEHNLVPLKSKHTFPNIFRPPYGEKELPNSYMERFFNSYREHDPFNDFQKDIDILFDTFLEGYNKFKAGKMVPDTEVDYKDLGIPSPAQYEAFSKLVNFFENGIYEFLNQHNSYFYDLTIKNDLSEIGMLEFVKNLTEFDFTGQEKKVVLSFGSFWGKRECVRNEMILMLRSLHKKDIQIQLNTNCKEEEIEDQKFLDIVRKTSHYGLDKRIPIHFVQGGSDFFFFEFPHTEKTIVRLNMFMDLNTVKFKQGKTKTDIAYFFNNLITKVLN